MSGGAVLQATPSSEPPAIDPDVALLEQIGKGDSLASRSFVDRHLGRTVGLANRVLKNKADAEEVAQEVFLRVWKQAANWEAGRAKVETWMYRVTLNLCYDRLRKKREVLGDEMPELEDERAGPGEALHEKELAARVNEAIERLPERQRIAITLCHSHEMSNIEAAAVMDLSVEALESLLARGRRKLKDLLRPKVGDLLGLGQ